MKLVRQIWYLALYALVRRYAAARLGLFWAVIQPAVLFGVFWFVSVYGLRLGGGEGPPFYAVLFCGLLPWMTLSAAVSESAGVLQAQRHLLNARALPPASLPLAVSVENGIVHMVLVVIVAAIFVSNEIPVTLSWLAVPYWAVSLLALSAAVGLVISVATAGSRDATHAVSVLLLIWFWGSPIVWQAETMPADLLVWLKLNPFFYIIEGYRGALLFGEAHAPSVLQAVAFWGKTALIALTGAMLYRFAGSRIREWIQ